MSGVATAIAGSALLGGALASDAQRSAANKAADAANNATNTSSGVQKYMFDTNLKYNQPFNIAGLQGLSNLTGMKFNHPMQDPSLTPTPAPQQYIQDTANPFVSMNPEYAQWVRNGGEGNAPSQFSTTYNQMVNPEYTSWEEAEKKRKESEALNQITPQMTIDPTGGAGKYMDQLANMPGLNLPQFNYKFDENDPGYQFRKSQLEKTINQQAAARGNYNSRPVINALGEGNMALTADETDRQFGRQKDVYGLNTTATLQNYGAGRTQLMDLFNMGTNLGGIQYGQQLDLAKIGAGAAGSAGSAALSTGQGLASTYNQGGASQAQSALMQGQNQSDLWSGIGAMPMNYMLMSRLYGGNTGYKPPMNGLYYGEG